MNVTFILWLKKKGKMKDKGPFGGAGGGRAGVCASLPWQLALLVLLRGQDTRP